MLVAIDDAREKLYNVLEELGPGWHDRTELAEKLGKKQLNPVEAATLDLLVSDGRIERVSQASGKRGRGGNITRYVYRVKEQK